MKHYVRANDDDDTLIHST